MLGRSALSVCLSERKERLLALKKKWSLGDVLGCVDFCKVLVAADKDDGSDEGKAVVIDFLKAANLRNDKVMRLDVCVGLLQVLGSIVLPIADGDSNDDSFGNSTLGASTLAVRGKPFAPVAMAVVCDLLEAFGGLVFSACIADAKGGGGGGRGLAAPGVDVEREQRLDKCFKCHEVFARLADRMCADDDNNKDGEGKEGGASEEKGGEGGGGGGGGGSGAAQFAGLIDIKDKNARNCAKRLQSLLKKYRVGRL